MTGEVQWLDITDFIAARLDDEDLLTEWASKVRHTFVEEPWKVDTIIVRQMAATWRNHPDYREDWLS